MGNGESTESTLESLLIDGLSTTLTRRMAERIVADVRRNRAGVPLPSDIEELLTVVRGDFLQAAFLRIGSRAPRVIVDVENRLLGLAVLPVEAWQGPRVRLVYVGRGASVAAYFAGLLGAAEVVRVDELFELLMALDTEERTLVVVDSQDTKLDPTMLARFVPDFPSHVLTFIAGSSPATQEAFLISGAAFRTTLRPEPINHPDVPQVLRDVVSGASASHRRSRSGISTTTEPRRAA